MIWILLNSCGDRISLNIYKKILVFFAFILSVLEVIQLANVDLCWSSRVRANANNLDIISGNNPKSSQGFFRERAIQTMLILILFDDMSCGY